MSCRVGVLCLSRSQRAALQFARLQRGFSTWSASVMNVRQLCNRRSGIRLNRFSSELLRSRVAGGRALASPQIPEHWGLTGGSTASHTPVRETTTTNRTRPRAEKRPGRWGVRERVEPDPGKEFRVGSQHIETRGFGDQLSKSGELAQAVSEFPHGLASEFGRRCQTGIEIRRCSHRGQSSPGVGWKTSWRAVGTREQFVPTTRMPRAKPAPRLKLRCQHSCFVAIFKGCRL